MQDVPQTPPAETIDVASMNVEDSYDGPHLQGQSAHEYDIAVTANITTKGTLHACASTPQKGCINLNFVSKQLSHCSSRPPVLELQCFESSLSCLVGHMYTFVDSVYPKQTSTCMLLQAALRQAILSPQHSCRTCCRDSRTRNSYIGATLLQSSYRFVSYDCLVPL